MSAAARLSTLDWLSCVMDSAERPLDFAVVLHLRQVCDVEALQAGARSARNLYPATGCRVDGSNWTRVAGPADGIAVAEAESDTSAARLIEDFLDKALDPRAQIPVVQLLIQNTGRAGGILVSRFHHAAADGISAALWLQHQMRVPSGKDAPVVEPVPFQDLPLRSHPSPVRRSRFAYRGPSHRLRTRGGPPSGRRRWRTMVFPSAGLRERCRQIAGFSYSDLLATCALEAFIRWNQEAGPARKIGLWLPINIRQSRLSGFGNGTSRIRVYARYADNASLVAKCRHVSRQIRWSFKRGEWAVPMRLPVRFMLPLLRRYLNRPWVDTTSAPFSHAEKWPGRDEELFEHLDRIECIGPLHRRHCVAINGVTHRDQTWLTFTYDPALLEPRDVEEMAGIYQEQITLARRELG